MRKFIPGSNTAIIIACAVILAASASARAEDQDTTTSTTVASSQIQTDDTTAPIAKPGQDQDTVVIQTVEDSAKKKHSKEVAWLGLAVEESSEALSSQLGLKHGEGLTVDFLAAGGPAAKAEFHKNDVLVDLDGQMLVHPMQLRKLVQMHDEGDTIKLTFYRGGKKQTVSVKLGKTNWEEADNKQDPGAVANASDIQSQLSGINGQLTGMSDSLSRARLDKVRMELDMRRTMEQTRKAIQDAVRRTSVSRKHMDDGDLELESLAHDGVDVDKDATIIVRNKHNSDRTVLQTDDTGTYIIEVGAKTHLTARDKAGKLLFEGEIDTPSKREQVPRQVWEKVEPMYDQIAAPDENKPKADEK